MSPPLFAYCFAALPSSASPFHEKLLNVEERFHISIVMALFSSLTPVFIAIICVLIGVIMKKTNGEKEKRDTKSKHPSRPWVDEDLKDGTDHPLEEEGKKTLIPNTFVF